LSIVLNNVEVQVRSITLSNDQGQRTSQLILINDSKLTITTDMVIVAENESENIRFLVEGSSNVTIDGDLRATRTSDNRQDEEIQINLKEKAVVQVKNDFIFYYGNSDNDENKPELFLKDSSMFIVEGMTELRLEKGKALNLTVDDNALMDLQKSVEIKATGGSELVINIENSGTLNIADVTDLINEGANNQVMIAVNGDGARFNSSGQLNMISTNGAKSVIQASGQLAQIELLDNLNISSQTDNSVLLNLFSTSKLLLGGNILRPTRFGKLQMDANAKFVYSGSIPQIIACSKIPDSGDDEFFFTKVIFANTSGQPMTMEGNIEVNDELELGQGIITTTDSNMVIVNGNATIEGGSANSYIDGPIIKRGANVNEFTFPVGHEGVFAPIKITPTGNDNSEYRALFRSCPPPFGNQRSAEINEVVPDQYWELTRNEDSDPVNITLNWSDLSSIGDVEEDSIVMVMFNENVQQWVSIGRSNFTGGIGAGEAGSVQNLISCPPPFGNTKFAVASVDRNTVSTNNVEQTNIFNVYPNPVADMVQLQSDNPYTSANIKVFNLDGSLLHEANYDVEMGMLQLPAQSLKIEETGVYFLQVQHGTGIETIKLMKL
ncbi:MAG: T9SS type A sorting domain-containing protein, partial [Bacteroidota bacterium]